MADAVRLSLFQKGADPAAFTLVAFGGAGGLHACAVAEDLNMDRVLFPATASTLSARGILETDIRHDLTEAHLMIADAGAAPVVGGILDRLREKAGRLLDADGIDAGRREIRFAADMRYRGQAWEITTEWPGASADALAEIVARFHALHQQRYAHSAPDEPVEIVALRARAIGVLDHVAAVDDAAPVTAEAGARDIYHGGGWRSVPTLPRAALTAAIDGPLIIEEAYSSIWIQPGWTARPLPGGDIIAERAS